MLWAALIHSLLIVHNTGAICSGVTKIGSSTYTLAEGGMWVFSAAIVSAHASLCALDIMKGSTLVSEVAGGLMFSLAEGALIGGISSDACKVGLIQVS